MALTNKKLIGARDPLGIRPLVLGELDGRYILASETCALDIIGARFVRDVENGEVVVISDDGHRDRSIRFPPAAGAALHLRIRLFRPPGLVVNGRSRLRRAQAHGRASSRAKRRPTPTSSCRCRIPACRRRSASPRQRGIPFELGIIRNHYVGRTFIQPTQSVRELGVRAEALGQPRRGRGQAHRAGRRLPSCAAPPR